MISNKRKGFIAAWLPLAFSLGLTTSVLAETVQVGGPLRAGHGRPPLHINLTPSVSTSYTPAQIRHAYGFDQLSATGANQKIAIVDAYGNARIQSYLDTFCRQFGLASTTLQILGNNSGADSGWAVETALDVEWAHAIAPSATIILSVAASSSSVDLLNAADAAVNAGATVVSMSWGGPEFYGMSYYDNHFNRSGVTFTASSGDSGAGVEWPAASPYVIAVGGTSLHLDSNGNRTSETAWSGSGGGMSSFYGEPAFQTGWQSSNRRGVPDVSYVADPNTGVYVYDGGWYVVGGTSAGAPQWAGLIALANNVRANNGESSLDSANNQIYSVAQAAGSTTYAVNSAYFYDVSQGNDGANSAGASYDFVTGLGSPAAGGLVPALAPGSSTQTQDFAITVSPGSANIKAGNSASYTITVSPTGGFNGNVSLSANGFPTGASASFNPASVNGSGSSTLRIATTPSTPRGTYTLTITGVSGSLAHSGNATLRIR